VRRLSLLIGIALIGIAFAAGTRVADSRQGLIAEVVALLGGLAGLALLLYGIFSGARPSRDAARVLTKSTRSSQETRTANDLVIGGIGIVLSIILFGGLAISGDILWAALGLILLLPMLAGSVYMTLRFVHAADRDWRIDLRAFWKGSKQKQDADHDQNGGPDDTPGHEPKVFGEKQQARDDEDATEHN
jgi:NAD/NADP transhydrogenase beta subunit